MYSSFMRENTFVIVTQLIIQMFPLNHASLPLIYTPGT